MVLRTLQHNQVYELYTLLCPEGIYQVCTFDTFWYVSYALVMRDGGFGKWPQQ